MWEKSQVRRYLAGTAVRPYYELFEAAIGLSVIVFGGTMLPADWQPAQFVFCALLLFICAISMRFHSMIAYSLAVVVALSDLLFLLWHATAYDLLHLALMPFLLLATGVLMSDLLRGQRRRMADLEQKLTHSRSATEKATRRYQKLLAINEGLERQVIDQPASFSTLSDMMSRLCVAEVRVLYRTVLEMVVQLVAARAAAVYMFDGEQWQRRAERSEEPTELPAMLDLNDSLVQRVIQSKKVYTIRDFTIQDAATLPASAVMAGPLVNMTGEVLGVVMIYDMPLLKFTPAMVKLFGALLRMISVALLANPHLQETPDDNGAPTEPAIVAVKC
jgi:hypothetical protein